MNIREAAKRLGVSQYHLRIALQKNEYSFGKAFKNGQKYTYVIFDEKLANFLSK